MTNISSPSPKKGKVAHLQAYSSIAFRLVGWLAVVFDVGFWLLPPRGALRVRGDRELGERDALPSRVCPLRGAWRLPYGIVPRAHDAMLHCDDALPPSWT